ncbi:peptide ABC transporter substrate-binding protein [Clostridium sp. CX1]|uniref:peptide ABC transporter substrate-binding protein n=1 Tax=Clostridium sp. CX1 TaxID=2978346 RepID=UPI0021BF581A|nr:peptide ABC transporter substrate-binding protein [Clostridium sp. CX1]MCT8977305.1 peptide ABC transporter substrate-binding protein [Clostridium sp. CX1]
MKLKRRISMIIIFFMLETLTLSGCKSSSVQSNSIENDKSQYLNMALYEDPKTLDQSKAVDISSCQVLADVNEALTRVEKNKDGIDETKPAGAERWDISSDGLKWVFYIRDNYWSDGKKVTAKDYEYGIKRTLDPKTQSENAFLLYPIKGAKSYNEGGKGKKVPSSTVGVKALDEKKLEITLEAPNAYFLNLTSLNIMQPQRKDIVDINGEKYGLEASTMVFCGPFLIKEWNHNDKVELVKNEDYWDGKSVKLEKITMQIVKSEDYSLDELANGSIDIAKVTKSQWKDKLNKTGKFDNIKAPKPTINYELFNQKDKLFSNIKVRKAFSSAIDREEISRKLWNEVYSPAYGWVPPSLKIGNDIFRQKANEEPVKILKEDIKDPRALLIEGLRELGLGKEPEKITVRYLQPGIDGAQKEMAEFFQQMYNKKLGINVKIEYVQWEDFQKKVAAGDYQIASMVWSADYNDPMSMFEPWVKGTNIISTGWSNSKYDTLVKEASSLGNDKNEERFKYFREAEDILLLEDVVMAPTIYKNKQLYKQKYIKGLMFPLFGPEVELKYAYIQGRWK